ncbi:MAG: LytTR family DNA-binding domain-containing protein [Hyphomonadaceae bacterium]|jgi:hypothetical protein|nr:LytTR family DNA-binding domain-containing protein [Hyphomonadaceae bacterium]
MTIDEARNNTAFDRPDLMRQAPQFAISAGVGVLLAVSGAFGTLETPLLVRLAYWVPIMLIGSAIGWVVSNHLLALERWIGSPVMTWLIVTIAVSLIMAPLVLGIGIGFGWASADWRNVIYYLVPSFAISGLMCAIGVFLNRLPQVTHGPADTAETAETVPARPAFLDRLPARLFGAEMIAVEAQDHYLKVHTSRGTDMILMRLADAVKELEGIEGARVHRSWWVAKGAVQQAERGNGKALLDLAGGLQVPVSRSYARALREDGWF